MTKEKVGFEIRGEPNWLSPAGAEQGQGSRVQLPLLRLVKAPAWPGKEERRARDTDKTVACCPSRVLVLSSRNITPSQA